MYIFSAKVYLYIVITKIYILLNNRMALVKSLARTILMDFMVTLWRGCCLLKFHQLDTLGKSAARCFAYRSARTGVGVAYWELAHGCILYVQNVVLRIFWDLCGWCCLRMRWCNLWLIIFFRWNICSGQMRFARSIPFVFWKSF